MYFTNSPSSLNYDLGSHGFDSLFSGQSAYSLYIIVAFGKLQNKIW